MLVRHKPYSRTTYNGGTFNWRTRAMLMEAEDRLGYGLTVVQDSYNAGVEASAGTHDGGGAVDLTAADWEKKVRVLRRVGFAAWYRPELWRDGVKVWGAHVHAIAMDDREASSGAKAQMADYRSGLDGLASHASDDFPYHPNVVFDYGRWQRERILTARLRRLFRKREKINTDVTELREQLRKLKH